MQPNVNEIKYMVDKFVQKLKGKGIKCTETFMGNRVIYRGVFLGRNSQCYQINIQRQLHNVYCSLIAPQGVLLETKNINDFEKVYKRIKTIKM